MFVSPRLVYKSVIYPVNLFSQDPKQQDLLKYFEESFIETEAPSQEADNVVQDSKPLPPAACSHQSGEGSNNTGCRYFAFTVQLYFLELHHIYISECNK